MERLTIELLSMVIAHLYAKPAPALFLGRLAPRSSPPPRISYASLSRQWQYVVESRNFTSIMLKSTEIDAFASVFSDPRRRTILRNLDYSVVLPTYGDSRHNHAVNLAVFQSAIKRLFDLLGSWECPVPDGNEHSNLELHISVKFDVDTSQGPAEFDFNVLKSSANRRYLTLNGVELPILRRINTLDIAAYPGLAPHPTAMCQLAANTPRLQKLVLQYLDPVNKRKAMRKAHRIALAAGLAALGLPELSYLRIERMSTSGTYNHGYNCGDLEEDGIDSLNDALRTISQSSPLTELHLSDTLISPHFFRGGKNSGHDGSIWPTLRRFNIVAGLVSPSGTWYYAGDPNAVEPGSGSPLADSDSEQDSEDSDSAAASTDSEDDDERDAVANGSRPTHEWRTKPNSDVFDPLIEDMAEAILRMPQLREGHLEFSTGCGDPIDVIVKCAEAGQPFIDRPDLKQDVNEDMATRRWQVWIGTHTDWPISEGVKQKSKAWLGADGKFITSRYPLVT